LTPNGAGATARTRAAEETRSSAQVNLPTILLVLRLPSKLHTFKALRIRYEHRADIHPGLLHFACAPICYRRLLVVLK
jgi:hypothetical protein